MLAINIRRMVYASLLPKSQMGRGIPCKRIDWASRIETAKELYSSGLGTFSLNRAISDQCMPVLLHEYWNKDWESSCFVSGMDPELETIEACEAWLRNPPTVGPNPSSSCLEDHSKCEYSVSSWPLATRVRGIVYWRTEVRTSKLQRQVSYVGEKDTYTFVQCLKHSGNVSFWDHLWAVRSTPDSLWFRTQFGLPSLDRIIGALARVSCVEHAVSTLCGEEPQIGSTAHSRIVCSVDTLYHNPHCRKGEWIKV
jgi:hypothetical protein